MRFSTLRPLPLFLLFGILLVSIYRLSFQRASANPYRPAGHDEYMQSEYGSLWAFVKAEEKIDAFLLKLEGR